MTIQVVPQPGNLPPRFQITISTPAGQPITAVSLTRTANGATAPTRVQPSPGPSPLVVFDSEAPRDTPVVYTATVTYGSTTEAYTSGPVVLSPTVAVLTHPTTPALSMILDQQDFAHMGVIAVNTETRAALKTKHRILESEYQVVTKTGPRAAPTLQMVVATVTPDERAGLIALLRDQTPLFITIPAAWDWDWDDGYYDVDDVGIDRVLQYGPERRRTFTLALERVEAPAGTQQPQRTWANVLASFATWNDVVAAYATWTDVLTDSRR